MDERGRWRAGRAYHYLDRAYAEAVEAAGGSCVYLPAQEDAAQLIERLDGLLLPGGDDLPPPDGAAVPLEPAAASQIAFDGRLLELALDGELPLLAICYGMQLLALRLGGRLVYDLPSERPEADPHRLPAEARHAVRVAADSRLAQALGGAPGPVNSLHHQAVDDPGPELRVVARAPDGIVEAIERPEGSFCIGVQWHPEKQAEPAQQRLFAAFVAACATRPSAQGRKRARSSAVGRRQLSSRPKTR